MPDFGAPVAKATDPSAPFEMLNQVLGLKQRQQQLQSGALTIAGQQQGLAGQAATVQQEQQTAAQRSGLADFFKNYDISQHVGADGTLNMDDVFQNPDLRKAAGDQFPQVVDSLIKVKQGQLIAKGQLAQLNGQMITQLGSVMGALKNRPEVRADTPQGRAMVTNAIAEFGATSPDAARIASIYGGVAAHAPPGKLWAGLNAIQLQAMDAATQAGKQAPSFIPSGDKLIQTNEQAAGGGMNPTEDWGQGASPSAPPGAPPPARKPSGAPAAAPTAGRPGQPVNPYNIRIGLSPTEQPDYKARVANVDPDAGRYNQISTEGSNAKEVISLSEQVAALSDQVHTGKFSKAITDAAAIAGQRDPAVTASQLLHKYSAQLLVQANKTSTTDESRGQVRDAMPNPDTMEPDALKDAARYIGGIGAMRLARSQAASDYVRRNGGSTNGLRATDDAFTARNDAFGYTYQRLPAGAERQHFLLTRFGDGTQITDRPGMLAFIARQKGVSGAGQ